MIGKHDEGAQELSHEQLADLWLDDTPATEPPPPPPPQPEPAPTQDPDPTHPPQPESKSPPPEDPGDMTYRPSPTGAKVLACTAKVIVVCGPVGGGKSTMAFFNLLSRAFAQVPHRGVRRTKFIILRNTMQQLHSTVKPLIDQWMVTLPPTPMGRWTNSGTTFEMKLRNTSDGTTIHSEFVLMSADTPEDVRRLLSVEATAAWVEEAREVGQPVFEGLLGRTNRFPNRKAGGATCPGVICSTNPPPMDSYWHTMMTAPPSTTEVFWQPPAQFPDGRLNPDADNLENLAPDYYESLVENNTREWVKVYLQNQFGVGSAGFPVFRETFRRDFHVATSPLLAVPQSIAPLVIGMDNGLQAAAVVGQTDAFGRVNILAEAFVPDGVTMGVTSFMRTILVPMLRSRFPGWPPSRVIFALDPACFQRAQVNEDTIAKEVHRWGYVPWKATTNDPERRVAAVEALLLRQVDAGPGVRFDPSCTHIINAMDSGYRWRRLANGQSTTTVAKNHASHIADALQYLVNYLGDPSGHAPEVRPKARTVVVRPYAYT